MREITIIELSKEDMEFAAGHFTIFSATRRERMHGHNFRVTAQLEAEIKPDLGMAFDYGIYKENLRNICKQLDSYFLLPSASPYLKIEEEGDYLYAYFNDEKIPFLKKDVLLLPVRNISVEELSKWIVQQLVKDTNSIETHRVIGVTIRVFSGPGQCGTANWQWHSPFTEESK